MESEPTAPPELQTPQVQVASLALAPPPPQNYPAARCSHEEVINNKHLFETTLAEVHQQLGITYDKIPKVGGKELDLHQLYINVTQLGGCERVISRKQWRDAAESFKFAPTITSVSFTLRKAYVSFLWDYEQIYFFRNIGPRVDPPIQKSKEEKQDNDDGNPSELKRRKTIDNVITDFPALPSNIPTALTALAAPGSDMHAGLVGTKGTVFVDGRFDCGFFVTVKLGKQGAMTEFKGVLYYPPPQHTIAVMPQPDKRGVGRPRKDQLTSTPGGSDKDKMLSRDPQAPKPNKTPFNFFSVDARLRAKELNPHLNQTEITKKVGEMWSKASDHEKAPYIALSNQDKLRYQAELEAYNYRLAAQAAQAQASQASQAVASAQTALQAHQQLPIHLFTEQMAAGMIPSTSPMMPQYQPQQYHPQYHEMPGEEDPNMS